MSNNDPLCPIMSVLYKCWTFYVCHFSKVCVVDSSLFTSLLLCIISKYHKCVFDIKRTCWEVCALSLKD